MITTLGSAQAEFASIVGAAQVVSDEVTCRILAIDGLTPKSVVYPKSPEQVAAVLKCATHHDLAVIPCRSATKLGIGNIPRRYDVALSLKELNNVWHYEPADLTVSVEAGIKLGDFAQLLARNGLWLSLDPPGGARSSLGGILATNAAGPLRQFYGAPRDMVVGMRIATTDGKIIKAGGRVVKNVAGYDLTKLLIGSYGSLGVIVEANLKLFPLPAGRATITFRAPKLEVARDLRRRIVNSPLTPMRMVLMNGGAEGLLAPGAQSRECAGEFALWVEAGGTQRVLERYARTLEELGRAAGASATPLESKYAEGGWARIADFSSWLGAEFPRLVILKASLSITAGEDFVDRAQQEAEKAKSRLAVFAQTGVGVVNLCWLDASDVSGTVTAIENLRRVANEMRGALVIERCEPEIKNRVDVWGTSGNDFEIMRKVKAAWDPKDILSPGRFLGRL
ncbi:MAG: FAD-binding oxidoreductase [Terriglobia bacterium]